MLGYESKNNYILLNKFCLELHTVLIFGTTRDLSLNGRDCLVSNGIKKKSQPSQKSIYRNLNLKISRQQVILSGHHGSVRTNCPLIELNKYVLI